MDNVLSKLNLNVVEKEDAKRFDKILFKIVNNLRIKLEKIAM